MNKNMGGIDRAIRIVVALVFFGLIAMNVVTGTLAIILGILGGVFILTSLIRWCPLYAPFKLSTCKTKDA